MLIVECLSGEAGLRKVLPLRHRVLVEQEGFMAPDSPLLQDDFDKKGWTFHAIAFLNGTLVGAVRYTLGNVGKTAADKHFDFGPYIPGTELVRGRWVSLC